MICGIEIKKKREQISFLNDKISKKAIDCLKVILISFELIMCQC